MYFDDHIYLQKRQKYIKIAKESNPFDFSTDDNLGFYLRRDLERITERFDDYVFGGKWIPNKEFKKRQKRIEMRDVVGPLSHLIEDD